MKSIVRKILVALVGFPVIILGIILVPLPGPGWLVILGGFLILSLEFEWARKHTDTLKAKLREISDKTRSKPKTQPEPKSKSKPKE